MTVPCWIAVKMSEAGSGVALEPRCYQVLMYISVVVVRNLKPLKPSTS